MSYYYLAASLPMLSLDGEPPISLEDFLNRCDEHLSKKDRTALDALFSKHDTASRHTFVRAWRDRETQLRNAIVRVRAQRQSLDPASFLHHQDGFDSSVEKAVADAFSRANPLERERALDRVRWATAEELSGFDPFTGSAILAYALEIKHRAAMGISRFRRRPPTGSNPGRSESSGSHLLKRPSHLSKPRFSPIQSLKPGTQYTISYRSPQAPRDSYE